MKRGFIFSLLCVCFVAAQALTDNLLINGGFEESSTSFLGTSFSGWDKIPAQTATVETEDKVEGNQSMRVTKASNNSREFYQEIDVSGFEEGTAFDISGYSKLVASVGEEDVQIICYFTRLNVAGQAGDTISKFWQLTADKWVVFNETMLQPEKASRLHVGIKMAVGVSALFDGFEVHAGDSDVPYMKVEPTSFSEVKTEINTEVTVGTFTIIQKNLDGMTELDITGNDAKMFSLSVASITGATESAEITVTYKPTAVGHHEAYVHISNSNNPEVNPGLIPLRGTCGDSSAEPVFTVNPEPELPVFGCVVGEKQTVTLLVHSENLIDYPTASIQVISEESGFLISQGLLSKNMDVELTVTFSPIKAGTYESILTVKSTDANKSFVYTLKGEATEKKTSKPPTSQSNAKRLEPIFFGRCSVCRFRC